VAPGRVERRELTSEVGVKLAGRSLERFSPAATWVGLTQLAVVGTVPLQVHVHAHDRVLLGDQGQATKSAADHGVGVHQAVSRSGTRLIGWSLVARRYCTA